MATAFIFLGEGGCRYCKGDGDCELEFEFEGKKQKARGCIRRMITTQSRLFLNFYQHYKNGFLLCEGGLLNQPAKYVQAMSIINNEVAKLEKELNRNGR